MRAGIITRLTRPWPALLGLLTLIVGLEFLRPWLGDLLAYRRSLILEGEWWRLLSAHLMHLGPWHAFLNGLGLLVFGVLCPVDWRASGWLWRLMVLGLGMSLSLLWWLPGLEGYVGLSGVIHGLFVLGLWPQARRGDLIAWGCLAYLLGKVGWEMVHGAALSDEAAIGGRVIVESHLYGSLTAVGILLAGGLTRPRPDDTVRAPSRNDS